MAVKINLIYALKKTFVLSSLQKLSSALKDIFNKIH